MWRRCSWLIVLAACKAPSTPVDSDPPATDTDVLPTDTGPFVPTLPPPDPDPDPCDALAITAPAEAGPVATVFLGVTGGLGPFTFAIEDNQSGGAINIGSGEWLTGPDSPAVDTVSVYDAGCDATDSAIVTIFPRIAAEPATATVPPGQVFDVGAVDGSGAFTCSPGDLEGGAVLVGCTFTAGAAGVSTVIVTDTGNGQTAEAVITVADGAVLFGESMHLVPVDSAYVPEITGGSGRIAIPTTPGLSVVGDALVASAAGTYAVEISDPLTGMAQDVTVVAADALVADPASLSRDGEYLDFGTIVAEDLDGDGFPELIVGTLDRSANARQGGAQLIYAGSATGPASTPALVLGSEQPDARSGQGLAVADFDGDGEPDLAVGEYLWDRGVSASVGRVRVYRGLVGGLVSPADTWDVEGDSSGDQLGYSVAACDVNADGYPDLIAGGVSLDDDTGPSTVAATGGVQVYFGGPDGLPAAPDRIWYAQRPSLDGTSWADARLAEAGSSLAVGDLDGDAGCDIAVGGRFGDALSENESRGGVWLLRDDELMAAPGPPWRVLGVSDLGAGSVELGNAVMLAPATGSEFDAVVVSSRYADNSVSDVRAGVVYAFRSQTVRDAGPATQVIDAPTQAEWVFEGAGSYDYIGQALAVAPDGTLRIGGPRITPAAGGGEHGGVFTVSVDFAAPGPVSADSVPVLEGVEPGGYFGSVVGVMPDTGAVVALAPRADHPLDVPPGLTDGALYIDSGGPVELEMPTGPVGATVGAGVAWVDVDGGGPDVLAGATGVGLDGVGSDSGALMAWSSGSGAASIWPALIEQDTDEALGTRVVDLGDLDGDGFDDVAVVAPGRSYSGPLGAPYAVGTCDDSTRSRAGAVYVWLGSAAGMGAAPDFVFFGADANDRLNDASRAFDFDGDGNAGIAIGSERAETVWVVDGPWSPVAGQIVVRCDAEVTLTGPSGSDFGDRVQAVPSVDGDACDELAVTGSEDSVTGPSRGALRLFRGCAGAGLSWKTWRAENNYQRLGGGGLAVGDVTGNGTADLVVGSVTLDDGASDVGAAWFIGDDALGSPVVWDNSSVGTDLSGLGSEVSVVPTARITGTVEKEHLGAELAIVGSGAGATVLVGRPGSYDDGGSVDGWTMSAAGFGDRWLRVGADGRYAAMGASLADTPAGTVVVAAPTSDAGSTDGGAVYVFDLP